MMRFLAHIRLLASALMLLAIMASAPTMAQKLGPDGAPDPTASGVDEHTLLKQVPRIEGRIDIPDTRAAVLIQPAGRTWDYFHEVLLHWGGAIVIVGTIVMLGLAYLIMGRIRISAGRSGVTRSPVTPSLTASETPPMLWATMGSECAAASR